MDLYCSRVRGSRSHQVSGSKLSKLQFASTKVCESQLPARCEEAEAMRCKLLARMGDVSEFMKTVKQRFSVWYNQNMAFGHFVGRPIQVGFGRGREGFTVNDDRSC